MIKQTIYVLIAILITAVSIAGTSQDVILIQFHYENGNFSIINKSLEQGISPTISHKPGFDYSIDLVSAREEQLYSFSFDPTILFSDEETENGLDGGAITLNETDFSVVIPSISEGEKVVLLKNGEKILEQEVYDVGASPCRIK